MERIDKVSDALFDLARDPALLGVAEGLLGRPGLSLHVTYIRERARVMAPSSQRIDHATYVVHFPQELALTLWVPLDDVSDIGGALEYGAPSPQPSLCPTCHRRRWQFTSSPINPRSASRPSKCRAWAASRTIPMPSTAPVRTAAVSLGAW